MRVLFVFSGNFKAFPISPFTHAQAESLRARGIEVNYFPIRGKGWKNYLKNVLPLRRHLKMQQYDIIHAHYSLCGWVAVLASRGRVPVVVSLMGDDAQGTFIGPGQTDWRSWFLPVLTRLLQPFVQAIVVKAPQLARVVWRKRILHIIPNGVRLEQFQFIPEGRRELLGLRPDRQYVLFLGNPDDPNKNIALVREALRLLNAPNVELLAPYPVKHEQVVQLLNSVDVLTLCSFGEGSPNVIKEAMACNCPVVTTPAGDAPWVLGSTAGCYVAGYDPTDFAEKLRLALQFARKRGRTNGRDRLLELGLDAETVGWRIENVYRQVLGLPLVSRPSPLPSQNIQA
ncbi:MAG: glycosyltransferase family 4 protein [Saprospiraceae bacterium]|nr:glycosyltransferase family 4 protein [Saprospiraceae bacterium]MDW8484513.1 glycosyltransferase family 4 protein [Saprospiraceae bacterium]